jgi:NAD(P)-dependent dehydrogenase (short-subunit alcohol dehydrogenase family)
MSVADVVDAPALEAAAKELELVLGPVTVWVNNAGIGPLKQLLAKRGVDTVIQRDDGVDGDRRRPRWRDEHFRPCSP